jgi:hypothetical protein
MSQTLQRPTNQMSAWLVFSGVAIGIVGATVKSTPRVSANSSGRLAAERLPRIWGPRRPPIGDLGCSSSALLCCWLGSS